MKNGWNAVRKRLGPVGLSLAAAAITAGGFAAFSLAADDGNGDGSGSNGDRTAVPAPPPGARIFEQRLSDEDRQKLEKFRQCMEDHGAPAPPRVDRENGPPEPPTEEERGQIDDAYEACKENLPEDIQRAGPPPFGHPPCGPGVGPPPQRGQDQAPDSGQDQ